MTSAVEEPPALKRKTVSGWRLWLMRVVLITVFAGVIAAFVRESLSNPWLPIFLVIVIGLVVLASIYPRLGEMAATALAGYFTFCFWMLAAVAPATFAIWVARKIEQQSSLPLQAAVFVVWGCLLCCATWFLGTEERRTRLFDVLKPAGALAPVAYATNVLLLALPLFGSLTNVLVARGAIHLTGDPRRAMDFYLWHFLSAIPLLKVNETLLWDQPLVYDQARVGWLLLIFKVLVIIPVIAAFRGYWKYTHTRRAPQEVEWHS